MPNTAAVNSNSSGLAPGENFRERRFSELNKVRKLPTMAAPRRV